MNDETKYKVSETMLKELYNLTNFDKLNANQLPDTLIYDGKLFVTVGGASSGAKGIHYVRAHEVIPIEKYKGNVEPLFQPEHFNEVHAGKRERGYHAQKLIKGKQVFVMINPVVYFEPVAVPKQIELF